MVFFMLKVELLYPKPAHVEIDPDQLWMSIIKVLKNAVHGKLLLIMINF